MGSRDVSFVRVEKIGLDECNRSSGLYYARICTKGSGTGGRKKLNTEFSGGRELIRAQRGNNGGTDCVIEHRGNNAALDVPHGVGELMVKLKCGRKCSLLWVDR
ncbi:Hypothetical protein BJL86_2697 [Dietzia timorensis]|uniref:Uncharacterized protein n=1 Tax=Dietzia timorensis TaxID=499555 RepID=A0A173LQ57_9ACTN|nr:Hypothetical protein BJL86_2697 [Dietzia timorensis]